MPEPLPSGKALPARPNLEQYRKQAKELLRDCRAGVADALSRLRKHHPRFSAIDSSNNPRVSLADAQLVMAREHGFDSWPKFAAHIEQLKIAASIAGLADPVEAFLRAALVPRDGASHSSETLAEANAILEGYPLVAAANIYTAAVLGDEPAVRACLARDKSLATATGGPYNWDALCHVCFSRYLRLDAARSEGLTGAARALLDAGANPNTGWYEKPWRPGDADVWESALYGAAGAAHHPGLTQLLLDRGADPNDGETPYHAPEGYDNTVLEILLKSGKIDERGRSWILARKADWHDFDGMRLALSYGSNPNYIPHWGSSALLHSILRDNGLEFIRLLLDSGGDPFLPDNQHGRNSVQMAAYRGRGDVLALLAERGIDAKLEGIDRLIAACALADRAQMDALIASEPEMRSELLSWGGDLLGAFAGVGNTDGVRCLLDAGVKADALYSGDAYFDTAKDSTALHVASWRARPATVKLVIERGTPVNALDGKGRTALQLAVRACVDSYWRERRTTESIEALLEAGASIDGIEIPCGYEEADELLLQYANQGRLST